MTHTVQFLNSNCYGSVNQN